MEKSRMIQQNDSESAVFINGDRSINEKKQLKNPTENLNKFTMFLCGTTNLRYSAFISYRLSALLHYLLPLPSFIDVSPLWMCLLVIMNYLL